MCAYRVKGLSLRHIVSVSLFLSDSLSISLSLSLSLSDSLFFSLSLSLSLSFSLPDSLRLPLSKCPYWYQRKSYSTKACFKGLSKARGAEAGGIFGVNTPHFFGLTTPTFWRDLKMGSGEKYRR